MELTFEEKKERVKGFPPIDDVFFETLTAELGLCKEIPRTIMEDHGLKVPEVVMQVSERSIYGCSVRLDALCTLGSGKKINIEVQRTDSDDYFRHARFNAPAITVKDTNPGEPYHKDRTIKRPGNKKIPLRKRSYSGIKQTLCLEKP